MPSIFYNLQYTTKFPVSFLLVERIAALLQSGTDTDRGDDQFFSKCIVVAMADISPDKLDEESTLQIVQRLRKLIQESEEAGKKDKLPTSDKGFAAGYIKWVQALDPAATCLVASNFDFSAAERLYSEVDRDDVLTLIELKLRSDWEHIKVGFESSVYAAGGSMGGDAEAEQAGATIIDLTKDNKAGFAAFAKLL